jgi:hypothetical protein
LRSRQRSSQRFSDAQFELVMESESEEMRMRD